MSSSQDAKTGDAAEKSARRRRPAGNRRRPAGGRPKRTEGEDAAPGAEPRERVKRERPATVPVPPEMVGKSSVGWVTDIIRRGRLKFGFINVGPDEKPVGEVPRIYFSFENLAETDSFLRRGYPVEFTIQNDEKARPYAANVKLTAKGRELAAEKEAAIAKQKAERGDAPRRAPRERKPMEERLVVLKVTCEGKAEEKSIEFNVAQSVGKLKNVACTAFEAPITYNVFHVSAENPKGEYLTKSVLSKMNSGDAIRLAEPTEEAK